MTARSDTPVTVLLSMRRPNGTTQFVDLLLRGATPRVRYRFFSWRDALRGGYDVLHIHWPELVVRDSRSRPLAFLKRRLMELLLLLLRLRRRPLVRTFHNPRPHEEGSGAERRSLDRIDRRTDLFIALNRHTVPDGPAETVVIPHGDYADAFRDFDQPEAVRGRIAYFGIIRPYKNVEALVTAFRGLDDPDLSLHIAGKPHAGQEERVRRAAEGDPRISLTLRLVDDAELVREVCEASLIVLPYREMRNSGALLVAASLGRPCLVPDSEVNAELAAELGTEWVRTYAGVLTERVVAEHLRDVEASGLLRGDGPDLSSRSAAAVGRLHEQAYVRAIEIVRGADLTPEAVRT